MQPFVESGQSDLCRFRKNSISFGYGLSVKRPTDCMSYGVQLLWCTRLKHLLLDRTIFDVDILARRQPKRALKYTFHSHSHYFLYSSGPLRIMPYKRRSQQLQAAKAREGRAPKRLQIETWMEKARRSR